MKILMIGPQGSGKSTQAELLAKHLNIPRISTGDIFRNMSSVKEILSAGKLVDDVTTAKIVGERLKEADAANGFILDGYPRNIKQKDVFDPGFDKVIYLKVQDEELMKRLMVRGRADDTAESIKTRLNLYYDQTRPLLDFYRNKGILTEINGMKTIEEIQNEIKKFI